ncbi:MAG TPA: fatty acid desaturase [Bacteroidia bacterium]|jgi:fatty acid desaturase|nr:fatty acid desaturase [Bacteroidia bacterium]
MSSPHIPEQKFEEIFRRRTWILPVVSLATLAILYGAIILCAYGFTHHQYWTVIPAAILAHAYMIIAVHDGTHHAITRSKADDVMMNIFGGFLLLPFFAEPFRRYHLIHHANTNTENDPLWSPVKAKLFSNNRVLYIICQFVPLLFTLVVLMTSEGSRKKNNVKSVKLRWGYMVLSFACSGIVIWLLHPPVIFCLITFVLLTVLGSIRHWCEHMGTEDDIESNTYWFPLGMGVGNHDMHHEYPSLSWLSLALGLRYRKYDTHFFRVIAQMLTRKNFRHYTSNEHRNRIGALKIKNK